MHRKGTYSKRALALLLSGALPLSVLPNLATPAFAAETSQETAVQAAEDESDSDDGTASNGDSETSTGATEETYATSTITRDSNDFFAKLSSSGKASFKSKISLADLEKLGIYFDDDDAAAAGASNTHVEKTGAGAFSSPAESSAADGAAISYDTLYTITIDEDVFDQGAQLTYTNGNDAEVSYNKRDVIQAVLYAISNTTQKSGFDGKTMYRVVVDYEGTIDLTNSIFVYSNTWLELESGTVMRKQFQSSAVSSSLADRQEASARQITSTNVDLLRNTAGERSEGGYEQCKNIVIDGGTWDANLATYNTERCGSGYQTSTLGFAHMKNLIVQNTSVEGTNAAHHLELSGIRNVTVRNSAFAHYDGTSQKEAIQIEPLHSKSTTINCAPYDDTPSRDIVIDGCSFSSCSRGIGNHTNVLGLDSKRIYIHGCTFQSLSAQAVLTVGCQTMRIEDNVMTDVATGVDVRITKQNSVKNIWMPHFETWTYEELVDSGFLNRNIKIIGNTISAVGTSKVDAANCFGTAISVWGQKVPASSTGTGLYAAGSYTITGVTVKDNTVTSATGLGVRFRNAKGCTFSGNTVSNTGGSAVYANAATSLEVKNNALSNIRGMGLQIIKSPSSTINGNILTNIAGSSAISLSGSTGTTCTGNALSQVYGDGISLSASTSNTIKGNELSQVSGRGVLLAKASNKAKVTSNTLSGVSKQGIVLQKSENATLNKNTLSGVAGYGIYLSKASNKATIIGNKITLAKKKAGVYITSTVTGTQVTNNRIVTSAATALNLRGSKTPAFTVSKIASKKVVGVTAARKKVTAYVAGKKVGSTTSGKKGKFTIKFKKKQAAGTTVSLRYKDASKNSIRSNHVI